METIKAGDPCCTGSHFYGSKYEILADFGPVDNIVKKRANYKQILRPVFHVFVGQKCLYLRKNGSIHTKKVQNTTFFKLFI